MVLATHALAGAVIGKYIGSPIAIAGISIVLHYAMDRIKHGEYVETMDSKTAFKNTWWKIALDFSIGLAIILLIITIGKFGTDIIRNIFIGMFFSMLPDLFTAIYWKTRWKLFKKLYNFHVWCHRLSRLSPERKWNLGNEAYEIIIDLAMIIILLTF